MPENILTVLRLALEKESYDSGSLLPESHFVEILNEILSNNQQNPVFDNQSHNGSDLDSSHCTENYSEAVSLSYSGKSSKV